MKIKDIVTLFSTIDPPLKPFRDANKGKSVFDLYIEDILNGLNYACRLGWYNLKTFDAD